MANRKDYYYKQTVTEGELDAGFDGLEVADRNLMIDQGAYGVFGGAVVSQHAGVANLSVDITSGAIYDQNGQRVPIPSLQNLDMSVDALGVSTAVVGGANSKKLAVFVKFARALSDPRTDGNSATVNFARDETFQLKVVQSAEAVSPVLPSLDPTMVLLADVTLVQGQTAIINANISTARREDAFVITGSPTSVRAGTAKAALSAIVTALNAISAGSVPYGGGAAWANGDLNGAGTAEATFDKIFSDLADNTGATSDGASRLGAEAVGALTQGSIRSQLNQLDTEWARLARANTFSAAQTFNGAVGDDQPARKSTSVPGGGNRKLEWVGPTNAAGAQRLYYLDNADKGFERTINAFWNPGTTLWNKDQAGVASYRERWNKDTYTLEFQVAGINTWATNSWTRVVVSHGFNDGIGGGGYAPAQWYRDRNGNVRFVIDHNGLPIGGHLSQIRTEWNAVSPALPTGWTRTSVGGGAPVSGFSDPDATHGARRRTKSVSANGEVDVDFTDPTISCFADQIVAYEFEADLSVVAASGAKTLVGFCDQTSTANPFSGTAKTIGLLYDGGASSNWMGYTRNGAAATSTDTGIAPVANTPVKVRIEFQGANTAFGAIRALFFINGVMVAENLTNVPTAAMQQLIYHEGLAGIAGAVVVRVSPTLAVWNRHLTPPTL